jgi:hypothetical protein
MLIVISMVVTKVTARCYTLNNMTNTQLYDFKNFRFSVCAKV